MATWRDAAKAMYIPYDDSLGVHPQAEGFTSHEVWDFAATSAEQYPLLLHFPYFDLYRKQVVKQADLVLAMHLRGDAFTDEEKARNFAYYEALTVRDSSLSACTQAVIAAEVGHLGLAHDYLAEAALMDLDDLEHNTHDGLHIAALAGTWIALVAGLAGMRERQGTLGLRAPPAPGQSTRLAIGLLTVRQRRLRIEITPETTTYRLVDGEPLQIIPRRRARQRLQRHAPLIRPTRKVPLGAGPAAPAANRAGDRQASDGPPRSTTARRGHYGPFYPAHLPIRRCHDKSETKPTDHLPALEIHATS